MQLYSHLYVARALLPVLQPADLPEYYWGAIAADVRYVVALPRRQTHVPLEQIPAWLAQYPDLRSFIQGYWVHLLADERDAAGWLYKNIPIRALRWRLSRRVAAVWLEAALVEKVPLPDVRVSGSPNPILTGLGAPLAALEAYARAANTYTASPSQAVVMEMLSHLGLDGNPGLERYLGIARFFQRHPRLYRILLGLVDIPHLTRKIVTDLTPFLSGETGDDL